MPRLATDVPVVVVQHGAEARHPFGTVRLARLGIEGLKVIVARRDDEGRTQCPPCAPQGAALLYPSADAPVLGVDAPRPRALVAVDGTWYTARKVIRDNPWLQALPRVRVRPPRRGNYRIRRAPDPGRQLSTIEAIVYALRALGADAEASGAMLRAFDTMIDRQLAIVAARNRAGGGTIGSGGTTSEV